MKKYLIAYLITLSVFGVSAQQLSPELICSGSGGISNGTTNVSWSIGETVIATMNSSNLQITNGIAQPTYIVTAVKNNTSQFDIKLFPNPARDFLVLQTNSTQLINATYTLTDGNGKMVAKNKISGENTSIDFSHLASTIYWISINDASNQVIQSYKIIKQ